MDKNRCFLDSRVELKRPRSSVSRQSLNCNRERVKRSVSQLQVLWAVKENAVSHKFG